MSQSGDPNTKVDAQSLEAGTRLRSALLAGKFPSMNALLDLGRKIGTDLRLDRDFSRYFPGALGNNELQGACAVLSKFYSGLGSELRLYRALHKIKKLDLSKPLGHHWSTATIDGGSTDAIVVCAWVPASSVNWAATFYANLVNPNEREVVVFGPVRIAGTLKNDRIDWQNPEPRKTFPTIKPGGRKDTISLVTTV